MHVFFVGWSLCQPLFSLRSGRIAQCLLPEEKMPNFVRRMPCCLTSRAMAISFLRRSTGAAPKPSPRGEDAELCSPDAVEASRLPPVPSGACLTSSLVCFCITCQAFFSRQKSQPARPARLPRPAPTAATARPAASPHQATPGQPSRTTPLPGQPSRTTPLPGQPSRTTPHPAADPHHAAPRAACPAPAPFPATAGFPQSFPHFCRFPTAAFFPLGFLGERQRQIF